MLFRSMTMPPVFTQQDIGNMNRTAAIKLYCFSCSGDNLAEAKNCIITDCPLYPFRPGQKVVTNMSEENRKAAGKRMAAGKARKVETALNKSEILNQF